VLKQQKVKQQKDRQKKARQKKPSSEDNFWMKGWYQNHWWTRLLLPVSWLFRGVASVRRRLHLSGQQTQTQRHPQTHKQTPSASRPRVPIMVIGNITLGGTGKTPLLIALVKKLQAAGWQPGVVSRGYGGHAKSYPLQVSAQTSPQEAGDEPVLIARETGCPVMVAPNRLDATQALLAQTSCNVVLSDDGLQHYKLPRDLEIVVIDGSRGLGNGLCLPAGPLREPPSRLNLVDWLIINGGELDKPLGSSTAGFLAPGFSASSFSKPVLIMSLKPISLHQLGSNKTLAVDHFPQGSQVHAVAGIGNPERFFQTLHQGLGLNVIKHSFADHHYFSESDLDFSDNLPVIMTAKDAVKCQALLQLRSLLPGSSQDNLWYLAVSAELPDEFYRDVFDRLGKCRDMLLQE